MEIFMIDSRLKDLEEKVRKMLANPNPETVYEVVLMGARVYRPGLGLHEDHVKEYVSKAFTK
jgi:hypothetical protein